MGWQTSTGCNVISAWEAAGKPSIRWTENDKEWINKYADLVDICTKLDVELSKSNAENLRLKHENEFMLKLINQSMKEV